MCSTPKKPCSRPIMRQCCFEKRKFTHQMQGIRDRAPLWGVRVTPAKTSPTASLRSVRDSVVSPRSCRFFRAMRCSCPQQQHQQKRSRSPQTQAKKEHRPPKRRAFHPIRMGLMRSRQPAVTTHQRSPSPDNTTHTIAGPGLPTVFGSIK